MGADVALLMLPAVGLIAGWLALRSIRRFPDEFTGKMLAVTGVGLCGIVLVGAWVVGLPVVLAATVLTRMYKQMGFLRFMIMGVHFSIMAMLPLKMVLRWLVNLKYFVYLPEFNLNL